MPIWLPYLPTILAGMYKFGMLLVELVRINSKAEIKECLLELDKARASGDTSEVERILAQMKKGKSCK